MMSGQPVQSLLDPAIPSKMPLLEGTIASMGLSKPGTMSGFLHKQCSGAYYTYDPRGKDGVEFPPPWNNSKTSLLSGRSAVSHLPGTEGKKRMVYRQDNKTFSTDEGHSPSSSELDSSGQRGFTYYTLGPNMGCPTASVVATPVPVRNQMVGGVNLSPPPENSVYLPVPKPVYGHSPCCSELGCTLGHRYSMECGPQRMPNILYDGEWIHGAAQYNHPVLMQGKVPETLLQPRSLQLEHNAERLQRSLQLEHNAERLQRSLQLEHNADGLQRSLQPEHNADRLQRSLQTEHNAERLADHHSSPTMEEYDGLSPNSTARTFTAYMEPNYSSFPSTATRTLLGPLTEQRQCLQIPPKAYHGLHLSQPPTYEHMAAVQHGIPSQVHQDRSHMPKYGQLTQRPMFYYPQANMEVESGAVYIGAKHIEDVLPTIHKPTLSTTRGHYLVPQPILTDVPMPSPTAHPNHAYLRGFDHPSYRIHLNASQMRAHLQRPCAPPPILYANGPGSSPPGLHMDRSPSSPATIHFDQSSLHASHPCASPPSLDVERQHSYLHTDQPSASSTGVQTNRAVVSPGRLTVERLVDYSVHQAQVTCLTPTQGHVASPRAPSQSPVHPGNQIHQAVNYSADPLLTCSPAAGTGKERHVSPSSPGADVSNRSRKRSGSRTPTDSPIKKVKEEKRDFFEIVLCKKRREGMERERERVGVEGCVPPMPVIDNVFSLAPYKMYLEASGMLFTAKEPQTADKPSEPCTVETEPRSPKRRVPEPVFACPTPKHEKLEKLRSCPDSPKEKPAVERLEPKHIKTESMDSQDKDSPVESLSEVIQDDHMESTVKEEVEESGSSDGGLLVVKKCEPDELECKPFVVVHECKAGDLTADTTVGSTQSDTKPTPQQIAIPPPKSTTPPQPPENKLNLQKIPPQCLKLSTYKIILPDILIPIPAMPREKPSVNPVAEPNPVVGRPARQHFLELHQSLCNLVSNCVSSSQEQELRTWVSKLELAEPASPSTKVQKVSCLLGSKAGEVWLNEEIKIALVKVLQRLGEYVAHKHCPFPHVMRAGAVFIPMLVVKELLFPQVLGAFVDQVLQEHRVELRPTTLSEEKILTQLHKRACSSKLRRLLSLKHLPDIYVDVVNLFYHACVCKRLGLDLPESTRGETDDCSDGFQSPTYSETIAASPLSSLEPPRRPKAHENNSHLHKPRRKGQVQSSSKRMFLSESEVEDAEQAGKGGVVNTFSREYRNSPVRGKENGGKECKAAEEDLSVVIPQEEESIDSWTRPLTPGELSSSPSDTEAATSPHSQSLGPAKCQATSKNRPCMILKLRRVLFNKAGRKARYQAISDPETVYVPPSSEDRQRGEARERRDERGHKWMMSKVARRWRRTGGFSRALRPPTGSPKRQPRSLVKIKYCPYLSVCHSAEHRRRWVLRSAVQRAQRAMKFYYPDLVGKRILHLYEEDDKSEVWYRGEVVGVHEAHPNPVKTVFEVRYDSEPEWKYYLELLIDYKKGWLKIDD